MIVKRHQTDENQIETLEITRHEALNFVTAMLNLLYLSLKDLPHHKLTDSIQCYYRSGWLAICLMRLNGLAVHLRTSGYRTIKERPCKVHAYRPRLPPPLKPSLPCPKFPISKNSPKLIFRFCPAAPLPIGLEDLVLILAV